MATSSPTEISVPEQRQRLNEAACRQVAERSARLKHREHVKEEAKRGSSASVRTCEESALCLHLNLQLNFFMKDGSNLVKLWFYSNRKMILIKNQYAVCKLNFRKFVVVAVKKR